MSHVAPLWTRSQNEGPSAISRASARVCVGSSLGAAPKEERTEEQVRYMFYH